MFAAVSEQVATTVALTLILVVVGEAASACPERATATLAIAKLRNRLKLLADI
jgi:hypothetical protein